MEDIAKHKEDLQRTIDKGRAIIDGGRVDEAQCAEINNELLVLHDRWEKLNLMALRFNKR